MLTHDPIPGHPHGACSYVLWLVVARLRDCLMLWRLSNEFPNYRPSSCCCDWNRMRYLNMREFLCEPRATRTPNLAAVQHRSVGSARHRGALATLADWQSGVITSLEARGSPVSEPATAQEVVPDVPPPLIPGETRDEFHPGPPSHSHQHPWGWRGKQKWSKTLRPQPSVVHFKYIKNSNTKIEVANPQRERRLHFVLKFP